MQTPARPHTFNRYPLFCLAVCFAAGILLAKYIAVESSITILAISVLAVISLAYRKTSIATLLISLAFVAAGVLVFKSEQKINASPERLRNLYDNGSIRSGTPVEIEGVLMRAPELAFEGVFLDVRSVSLYYRGVHRTVSGDVRVFSPTDPSREFSTLNSPLSTLKYGSRIRVVCALELDDEYLNPGVVGYRELLDRAQTDATCSVKSPLLIEHVADEPVFLPLASVHRWRTTLIDEFRTKLEPRAAGVMIASLLGNEHFLDKDTAGVFRDGGTFHILVISGLHITFIGGLLLFVIRRITNRRWVQFVATTSVLWAYTLSVGGDVPVVRAAIMFTIISFSFVIYRQSSLLNSFGLCAIIILLWRPSDLLYPSFQLTFVSVAAIIGCAFPFVTKLREIGEWTPAASKPFPPNVPVWLIRICETLYWRDEAWRFERKRQVWTANITKAPYFGGRIRDLWQKVLRYLFEGLFVSLIVQFWMLPLSVVYFHRISIASVVLNLWVGILIALGSFAAVAGSLSSYFSELMAGGFYAIAGIFNRLMLALPQLVSDNAWASFRLPAYSEGGRAVYVIYFVPVVLLAFAANRWRPFDLRHNSLLADRRIIAILLLSTLTFSLVIAFHPFSTPNPDGRLHVEFLDVGQGDSILVTFPNGRTMLVDGGGQFDYRKGGDEDSDIIEPDRRRIGEAVVSEVLWAKGYSRIDHILATHAHADHMQGLVDVARNFEIATAIFGRTPSKDEDFVELQHLLRQRGVAIETVSRGDVLQFGDIRVEVLHPFQAKDANAASENDDSVVLRIVYGSRAILLTGDIERAAENALLVNGGTLNADIVKVAHHGSRTSSTFQFVAATRARYAIIPVGRNSPFGHPHAEVVERWLAAGVRVFKTGDNGMISVSTNGSDLVIEQFAK